MPVSHRVGEVTGNKVIILLFSAETISGDKIFEVLPKAIKFGSKEADISLRSW